MTSPGRKRKNRRREQTASSAGTAVMAREENTSPYAQQVRTVLNFQRWESRDAPFAGFGSPPGKF